MSGWIKCSERMPEVSEDALFPTSKVVLTAYAWCEGEWSINTGRYAAYLGAKSAKGRAFTWNLGNSKFNGITHWQPMPAPPEAA